MDLQNATTEDNNEESKQKWTDYDETMLEKSVKELEKGRITEHEKVIKKIKKQYIK